MSSSPNTARIKVWSVPSIADKTAPTVAELNAGVNLTCVMTPDGLAGFNPTTAEVDDSSLCSSFALKTIGRDSYSGTMLKLKKQIPLPDVIHDTLVRGYETNIVVRRDVATGTAWTAGDEVEVYPVICGSKSEETPEADSMHKYDVPTLINDEPELRATVAA